MTRRKIPFNNWTQNKVVEVKNIIPIDSDITIKWSVLENIDNWNIEDIQDIQELHDSYSQPITKKIK